MPEVIRNLDGGGWHQALCNRIAQLRGMYRIDVTRYRPRRSDRQNRYYWPCVVKPFGDHLREHGNDYTDDQAHDLLKHKFLRDDFADPATGELIPVTRSTTSLDTGEFNKYVEQCAAWLASLGLFIEPPQAQEMAHA